MPNTEIDGVAIGFSPVARLAGQHTITGTVFAAVSSRNEVVGCGLGVANVGPAIEALA